MDEKTVRVIVENAPEEPSKLEKYVTLAIMLWWLYELVRPPRD